MDSIATHLVLFEVIGCVLLMAGVAFQLATASRDDRFHVTRAWVFRILPVLLVAVAASAIASGTEFGEWGWTSQRNSYLTYRRFLLRYPASSRRTEVVRRLGQVPADAPFRRFILEALRADLLSNRSHCFIAVDVSGKIADDLSKFRTEIRERVRREIGEFGCEAAGGGAGRLVVSLDSRTGQYYEWAGEQGISGANAEVVAGKIETYLNGMLRDTMTFEERPGEHAYWPGTVPLDRQGAREALLQDVCASIRGRLQPFFGSGPTPPGRLSSPPAWLWVTALGLPLAPFFAISVTIICIAEWRRKPFASIARQIPYVVICCVASGWIAVLAARTLDGVNEVRLW